MSTPNGPSFCESLVLFHEGPLDRLMDRMGLGGCSHWQRSRRILFWIAVTWLPTFLSAGLGSLSSTEAPLIDIYNDLAFHVRCLIAVPILLWAECYVQTRMDSVIPIIIERGMILGEKKPVLSSICNRIRNLQRSGLMEILLLILSMGFVANQLYLDPSLASSWKAVNTVPYVFAREWNRWIGMTIYYFFLLRWVWRFLLWCFFLFKLRGLRPVIHFLHGDQVGGLSFLNYRHANFAFVSMAISTVITANIAEAVIFGLAKIESFLMSLALYLAAVEIILFMPLLTFTPLLIRTKKDGIDRFGNFSHFYADRFDQKWLTQKRNAPIDALGTPDIQSLNDLIGSYAHLMSMRIVLMNQKTFIHLAILTIFPLIPLLLFKVPLSELFKLIAKFVM